MFEFTRHSLMSSVVKSRKNVIIINKRLLTFLKNDVKDVSLQVLLLSGSRMNLNFVDIFDIEHFWPI